MPHQFPSNSTEFLKQGEQFRSALRDLKQRLVVPDYGWYPYESLSALEILAKLFGAVFDDVAEGLASGPVVDLGCGDGDLALFCADLGADVDAVDHLENNFNQMRGVRVLREGLGLRVRVHDIDLDGQFHLPRPDYRFAFFLGTLYHLKNPYYALENLAAHADWCVLSTRIARITPRQTRIEEEPVSYLLGAREANNDPTNYWIFSAAGLRRLLERTGWTVFAQERVGRGENSDPVHADADERMFVLLKSRPRFPELFVRPLYGWFEPENAAWRWTAKSFGLEVVAPVDTSPSEFALRIQIPAPVVERSEHVRVSCTIDGHPAGALTSRTAEALEFRGRFPHASTAGAMRLDFVVESGYVPSGGDLRDLGIIVPLLDSAPGNKYRIPFRIS